LIGWIGLWKPLPKEMALTPEGLQGSYLDHPLQKQTESNETNPAFRSCSFGEARVWRRMTCC